MKTEKIYKNAAFSYKDALIEAEQGNIHEARSIMEYIHETGVTDEKEFDRVMMRIEFP